MSFLGDLVSFIPGIGPVAGKAINMIGGATSNATQAAGNNRLDQQKLALEANNSNISGNSAMQAELMQRAAEEDAQRKTALKQLALQSAVTNPSVSKFNTQGVAKPTFQFSDALNKLALQNDEMLATPSTTQVGKMAPVPNYTPLPTNADQLQKATGTNPSLFEKIGQIAGPVLSGVGALAGGRPNAPAVPAVPGMVPAVPGLLKNRMTDQFGNEATF